MWAFLLLRLCKLQALLNLFSAGCIINCSVWWYDRTASSGSSQRVSCWAIWALKHGDNDQEPTFINRFMCFHSAYKAHTSQDQTKCISYGHKPKKVFNLYERDKKIKQPVSDAVEGWDKGEKWRQSVNAACLFLVHPTTSSRITRLGRSSQVHPFLLLRQTPLYLCGPCGCLIWHRRSFRGHHTTSPGKLFCSLQTRLKACPLSLSSLNSSLWLFFPI